MLALLAAGSSRRFGEQDKLGTDLRGKMLGLHAAEMLSSLSTRQRIVVASDRDHPCTQGWRALGFEIIVNNRADEGQSTSVQLAAKRALHMGASGLCICLADMPFVTAAHIQNLLDAFDGKAQTVASSDNGIPMPPALFPASELGRLEALRGDQGARKLLDDAKLIHVNEPILTDIDTIEQLQRLNGQKG